MKLQDAIPRGWVGVFVPDQPKIGLGLDIATTEKQKSNPSALAVTQYVAPLYFVRLLLSWKTADPNVTRALVRYVLEGLPFEYKARKLCIDATSERFFAAELKREFYSLVSVDLVVASEATEYMGERMTFKQYLGNLAVNTMEDGQVALPNERWLQKDFRLVVRDRGTFDCDVDEDGRHGDTFDAVKLSLHAITSKADEAYAAAVQVGSYGSTEKHDPFSLRPDPNADDRPASGPML